MMDLEHLIGYARSRLDDLVEPYLWSDQELTQYANQAVIEACLRADLLQDDQTIAICSINVVAGQERYPLHPKVILIKRATMMGNRPRRVLPKSTTAALMQAFPDYPDQDGTPEYFVQDVGSSQIGLFPRPVADEVLQLLVSRLPLSDLVHGADIPEIHPMHHAALVYWMVHEALLKEDSETRNEQKAMQYLQLFEAQFGPRKNAQEMEQQVRFAIHPGRRR
ncbi:MAG: hypothetical protein HQL95_00630 [Magnetococcales bacterium]|nr:hypothetical protein [Magnetococcales bacterium]